MLRNRTLTIVMLGLLPLCAGCPLIYGICEIFPAYIVRATIVNAGTSAVIVNADVSIQLLRAGLVIPEPSSSTMTMTNDQGEFDTIVGLNINFCGATPEETLGDPPDQLRVVVQVGDQTGEVVVSIAPGAVTIESPSSGVIQLPPIEVTLATP